MDKHSKRKMYLENTPLDEAKTNFIQALEQIGAGELPGETVSVELAVGRVTEEPVFARSSYPHYHASAMDGVAVSSSNTQQASLRHPQTLLIPDEAVLVDTGDPLPKDKDAVIMIENINWVTEEKIEIVEPVPPWNHVRNIGEDLVATELIVPSGHELRPVDIGAILAAGVTEINVIIKPQVSVIPTGDELVEPGEQWKPGDIIEFNSRMISNLVSQWGGCPYREESLSDDYHTLASKIKELVPYRDLIVVNAGSSAGSEDYTYQIINDLGKVLTHGVAIKPGKPVILGIVENTPVIGIPGYPVSAVLTTELFVKPLLYKWLKLEMPVPEQIEAKMSRRVVSSFASQEYLRVKLGKVDDNFIATPLGRGASMIMSLVNADGVTVIPQMKEGVEKGEQVTVNLYRHESEVESTVVGIGSHDISLDILADQLSQNYPSYRLSSAHAGSMGGIMALKRGEAHIAGIHLLDPESGEYNLPYLERYLPGQKLVLVHLAYRQQGLIVSQGNPKNISSLQDLTAPNIEIVNRQRGAGTRMLLDYHLEQMGISSKQINGYQREEFNHLSVASAVSGGTADCGLGIRAAAEALDLDFVPIANERYDLVIPEKFWHWEGVQHILQVLRSQAFKQAVEKLPGYDLSSSGEILHR